MVTKVKRWLHKVTAPTDHPLPPHCEHAKGWGQWRYTGEFEHPDGVLYMRECHECGMPQAKRIVWDRLGNGS